MKLDFKFNPKTIGPDLGSGLTVALVSIPEGMAYAMVASVDPIYGLYTGMVTTIVAALTGSTSLMVVTLTNAMALVTADALVGLGPEYDPIRSMFTLTLLVGAIMFLLGVLRLGSVIRFVSTEVMSAFIFATALLIVLGQYGELVGHESLLEANRYCRRGINHCLGAPQTDQACREICRRVDNHSLFSFRVSDKLDNGSIGWRHRKCSEWLECFAHTWASRF